MSSAIPTILVFVIYTVCADMPDVAQRYRLREPGQTVLDA